MEMMDNNAERRAPGDPSEENTETLRAILEAVVREHVHEYDRFKQVEQKCAILLTFSGAVLVVLGTGMLDVGGRWLSWTFSLFDVVVVLLVASISLTFLALWFRPIPRLCLDHIVSEEIVREPPEGLLDRLALTYRDMIQETREKIDGKVKCWKAGAALGLLALIFIAVQSIILRGK